jgi:hypothetical protein
MLQIRVKAAGLLPFFEAQPQYLIVRWVSFKSAMRSGASKNPASVVGDCAFEPFLHTGPAGLLSTTGQGVGHHRSLSP